MKKSLLALMLAVALVAPAFAAKDGDSKFDIVGKIGLTLNPSCNANLGYGYYYEFNGEANSSGILGVEGLYKVNEKISAGIGISYIFPSEMSTSFDDYWDDEGDRMSLGFINIYATIKPKLLEGIYAIAQIGYGIPNFDFDNWYNQNGYKIDGGGIYGGLGAGIEYKSFIFEALYSINTATFKDGKDLTDYGEYVFTYSTLSFNVGYKFSI